MSRNRLFVSIPALRESFQVVKKIGQGSFSDVHLVRLKDSLSKEFALKCLVRTTHPKRAEMELRILRDFGGRNNVVRLFCSFRKEDKIFLLLEYFPHSSFHSFCNEASIEEIRDYVKNLLIALRYIHQHGLIHHDVKPSNFLYDRQRKRYALIDFGLAEEVAQPALVRKPHIDDNPASAKRAKRMIYFQQGQQRKSPRKTAASLTQPAALRRSPRKLPNRMGSSAAAPGYSVTQQARKNVTASGNAHLSCECFGRGQYCKICISKPLPQANHAGTAGFRAPETLMNASAQYQTSAIDIWACGIVLLSLLSRRYPFMKPGHSGEGLAFIMTLMGTQHVASAAKAIGVKLLYNHYCSRLDLRELCALFRLGHNAVGIQCDQSREPCLACMVNFRGAVSLDDKLFCICHSGRTDRGPLFSHCLEKEFGNGQEGNDQTDALLFEWAFDLLYSMLEVNPLSRVTAEKALYHSWFET